MHLGDAFSRVLEVAIGIPGTWPNAPQALSSNQSRGLGWGAWNLGSLPSLPSTVPTGGRRRTQRVMYWLK